jgi:hypothetical protein
MLPDQDELQIPVGTCNKMDSYIGFVIGALIAFAIASVFWTLLYLHTRNTVVPVRIIRIPSITVTDPVVEISVICKHSFTSN